MVLQRAAAGRHGSRDGQARRVAGVRCAERRVTQPTRSGQSLRTRSSSPRPSKSCFSAGDIQMSRRESGFRVDKKGTIDLVTEVDLECERMCRAILAERFPDHDVLAEELSKARRSAESVQIPLGLRSARRHDQLCARPAHLLLVAGTRDRRQQCGRRRLRPDASGVVHRGTRSRGVSQRAAAANVNQRRIDRRAARHRVSLRRPQADRRPGDDVRRVPGQGTRGAAAGIGGARFVLRGRRALRWISGNSISGRGTSRPAR